MCIKIPNGAVCILLKYVSVQKNVMGAEEAKQKIIRRIRLIVKESYGIFNLVLS